MRTEVSLSRVPRTMRAAASRLEEKVEHALSRFGRRVRAAELVVRGGERDGVDLSCTVKVALARGKAVVVKATGATPAAAAAEGLRRARRVVADRLETVAARNHGRRRVRRAVA